MNSPQLGLMSPAMAIDYAQIGQRLRAHRMGLDLSPDVMAERLGISRAALYNYERGTSPVKLETLERIADFLGASLPSLLGVGTEYFSSAIAYFERLRQIEAASERLTVNYEPITLLLSSPNFPAILKTMLVEGLPASIPNRKSELASLDRLIGLLEERRTGLTDRRPGLAGIVGATQIRRLVRTGFIGTYDLPPKEREKRRAQARAEVEWVAGIMTNEPVGVQIGIVDDTLPNQTFEICRLRDGGALVAVSPFRLGELPNVRLGVASITSADDAVRHYEKLADEMWKRAAKGREGAKLLLKCIEEGMDH